MLGSMRFGAPRSNMPYVDVRDVAAAHVLAAERDVSGRFIIANDDLPTLREMSQIMNRLDPSVPAAPVLLPDFLMTAAPAFDWLGNRLLGTPRLVDRDIVATMRGKVTKISTERAKAELGWRQSVGIEKSLTDTMAAIRALRRQEGRRGVV